jgi:hypothetical protein
MSPPLPGRSPARGLAALRRMMAVPSQVERCELCAAEVPGRHQHLVDPERRRLVCACDACAILFDHAGATKYRRVPRDIRELPGVEIDDALWNSLGIPIGLVFFFRSSASNSILAVYPSPGGPTETSVEPEIWEELAALHSSVASLADDVEALLVNRTKGARDCYIVPIDECYMLAGIIRQQWTGLSGGDELWESMRVFFDGLKQRAFPERSAGHA